ncbi:Chaperone protein DnaJ [Glycine soja]
MESHLLVGPISVACYGGAAHFHSAAPSTWASPPRRRSPLVVASWSSAAVNGGQNHHAILGVARTTTTVQIKRSYQLLARKRIANSGRKIRSGTMQEGVMLQVCRGGQKRGKWGKDGEVVEDEPVFGDDSLTWGIVGDAIGVGDPARLTRQHTRLTTVAPIEEEKEEEHIFNDGEQEMRKKLEVEIVILFKESLYHPDVSKDPQAAELFKSIHDAYKVLSNEAARVQYDQELQFGHKPYREKWSYGTEFEDQARFYRWDHLRKKNG